MAAAFPVEAWLGVPGDSQQLATASAIAQRFPPHTQRAAWAAVQAAAAAASGPGALGAPGAPGAGSSGGALVPGPAAPRLPQSPGSGAPAALAVSPSPASEAAPAALGIVRQLSQHRFFIPISTANAAALSALLSASCQRLHPQERTDQWDLALHCLLLLAAWARKLWAAPGPLGGTPAAATRQAPAPQAVARGLPPGTPPLERGPAANGRRVPAASSQDGGPGARQATAMRRSGTAVPLADSATWQDGPKQGLKPAPPLPDSQQLQRQVSQGDSVAARASQGALKLCSAATLAGAAAAGVAARAGWAGTPASAAVDAGASRTADADPAAGGASPEAAAGAAIYCLGCFLSSRGLGSPGKEAAADAILHSLARLRGLWGLPGQSQADGEGAQALQRTLGGGERIRIEQDRGLHRAMAGAVYALCSSAALEGDSQAGCILVRVLDLFRPSRGPSAAPRPPQGACVAPDEAVRGAYSIPPLPECHRDKETPRVLVLQRAIQQETDVCFAQGRLVLRALEYVGAYWHSFGVPAPGAVQALAKASTPVTAVESATAALSQALLAQPSSQPGTSFPVTWRRGVQPWCAAVFAAAGLLRGLCGSASRSKSSATGTEEPPAGAGAGRQAATGAPDRMAGGAGEVGTDRVATERVATSPLWSQTLGALLGPAVARLAECLVAAAEASCPWAPTCSLAASLPPQLSPAATFPLQQDSAVLLKPGWINQEQLAWLARHFPGQAPGLCWPAAALGYTGSSLLSREGNGRGSSSTSAYGLAGALVCLRCAAVALAELAGGGGPGLWRVRGSQGVGRCLAAALLSDCLSLAPLRLGDALVAAFGKEEAGDWQGRPLGRCPPAPGIAPTPSPQADPPSSASAVHAQGAWFRRAPLLTRALVEHAKAAPPWEKAWLSQTLLAFATCAHQGERSALGVLHACQSTSCAPTQGQLGPRDRQAGHAGALPSPLQGCTSLATSAHPSPAGQRPKDVSADTISGTAYTVICLLFTALTQGSPEEVSQPSASWPPAEPAAVHQAVAVDALASLALLDFSKVGLGSLFVSLVARCSVLVSSSTPAALALLGRLPPHQDVMGNPLADQSAMGYSPAQWHRVGLGLAGEEARDGSASGANTEEEAEAPWKPAMLGPGTGGGFCVDWTQDAPTTARVVFLFRILLPAMPLLPVLPFCTTAGPLLLLYLGHTNSNAAVQASHDLFVALLTAHSQADSIASPQSRHNLQAFLTDLRAPLLLAPLHWVHPATGDGMPWAEGRSPPAPGGVPRMRWGPKGDVWVAFAAQSLVQAREVRAVSPLEMLEAVSILYTARALQAVPGVTPLALLGRGLAAMCRNLAPGSQAVEVCVDLLAEKAGALLQEASGPDCHTSRVSTQQPLPATSRRGPAPRAPGGKHSAKKSAKTPAAAAAEAAGQGSVAVLSDSTVEFSGDGGKISNLPLSELRHLLLLLLHLVPVVDIQVLPHLLRRIAARITSLNHFPDTTSFSGRQLQREALGELLQVILGSDDYTRKPALISFYQSLALVSCRQVTSKL